MARQRQKSPTPPPGAPLWVLTYSDLMSLLLAFFVLMVALSKTDVSKARAALNSIRGALGMSVAQLSALEANVPEVFPSVSAPPRIARLARELQRRLQVRGEDQTIKLRFDAKGGLMIPLPSKMLFDTARAQLKPAAYPVLTDLGQLLSGLRGIAIEVRGFTDSRPLINTTVYKDNYDLSYARAKRVTMFLNTTAGIPLDEFEIIAQGPTHPVATNDTPEGQQANRRVEIYVRDVTAKDDTMKALTSGAAALAPSVGGATPGMTRAPAPVTQ